MEKYICYYRVSTQGQGETGLGLAAQKNTVMKYLDGKGVGIIGEFTEVASGGKNDRPELQKALLACRLKKARLIVSKLDRLSRDLHFISELKQSAVPFVIAEMPDATELTVNIYAAMAQHEREVISSRTKDALSRLKASGVKLGSPILKRGERIPGSGDVTLANMTRIAKADTYAKAISSLIADAQGMGLTSLREIADYLNGQDYKTMKGGEWHATSVARIIKRMDGAK
jgi:DNA invertase Pin-like site-specific DNA recombinase